jgi:hypothetical protein
VLPKDDEDYACAAYANDVMQDGSGSRSGGLQNAQQESSWDEEENEGDIEGDDGVADGHGDYNVEHVEDDSARDKYLVMLKMELIRGQLTRISMVW